MKVFAVGDTVAVYLLTERVFARSPKNKTEEARRLGNVLEVSRDGVVVQLYCKESPVFCDYEEVEHAPGDVDEHNSK